MRFHVEKIDALEWKKYSNDAHLRVFLEKRDTTRDRIDFALLVFKENEKLPVTYVTCREFTSDILYLQYGGSFENYRGSNLVWLSYLAGLNYLRPQYKSITSYVKNTNMPYLKMAMKAGFKIVGVSNVDNEVYVDLWLDLKGR